MTRIFSYHVVVAINSASASVDAAHPVLVVLDEALSIIRDVSFKRKNSILRVLGYGDSGRIRIVRSLVNNSIPFFLLFKIKDRHGKVHFPQTH